ncbi:MAG: succinylglutamate desuccinylase/aspartoacylase family protein [Planctomycetaceae bacterium]|nr:succinylglutamate desuccinylase/aspartoacylase family protein [Planctomycetaceae bacterium]
MELKALEIHGHRPGPELLITAGVHGDEFEPMAAVRWLMTKIDPQHLRGKLTLVPVVNESAFRLGRRTGEDGKDLARTCPGRDDGSLTEQVAFALSRLIRSADFYIDLHTGGTNYTVLPLSGYTLHADPNVLAVQRRMAQVFGLDVVWGTDPNLEGRSLSVARDANVPAIYCEYLGGGRCDPVGIEAYVRGCRNVMIELGLLDGSPDIPHPPLVVEDHRPGAGHMQINHPSPCEGFFDPAVALGQRVRVGELIGTVCDVLGERVERIESRYTGVIIVLHTFPTVAKDDSVAVVMETTEDH